MSSFVSRVGQITKPPSLLTITYHGVKWLPGWRLIPEHATDAPVAAQPIQVQGEALKLTARNTLLDGQLVNHWGTDNESSLSIGGPKRH